MKTMDQGHISPPIRLFREQPEPLATFCRPGPSDHLALARTLADDDSSLAGIVFDASRAREQVDLHSVAVDRNLWSVLDPKFLELSTTQGFSGPRLSLPWALAQQHQHITFTKQNSARMLASLAEYAVSHGFSAVLSPTHFLQHGSNDAWWNIDRSLVIELRKQLDLRGGTGIAIFYSLSTGLNSLKCHKQRAALRKGLSELPIESLWLRVNHLGTGSSHVALKSMIVACRELHQLGIPIVAERVGLLGVPLLSLTAISGVEIGVSSGEQFDFTALNTERSNENRRGGPCHRVYLPGLYTSFSKEQANDLFKVRGMKQFMCIDDRCCSNVGDMIGANSRRHFVRSRAQEVKLLSDAPFSIRPNLFLNEILRPATDSLGRISNYKGFDKSVLRKFERQRGKLYAWQRFLAHSSIQRFGASEAPAFPRQVLGFKKVSPPN